MVASVANNRQVTYFIQSVRGGPIKIGWSSVDVRARLSSLQTGNPEELRVLGTVKDSELQMHGQFAQYRIRGEWFACGPSLALFIKERFGIEVQADPTLPWLRPAPKGHEPAFPLEKIFDVAASRVWPFKLMGQDAAQEWAEEFADKNRDDCLWAEGDAAGDDVCDCEGCLIDRGMAALFDADDFLGLAHIQRIDGILAVLRRPRTKDRARQSLEAIARAGWAMDDAGVHFDARFMPDYGSAIQVNVPRVMWAHMPVDDRPEEPEL